MTDSLTLVVLPERLAVCRLEADARVPDWATGTGPFHSVTRTAEELSIVLLEANVPEEIRAERGFRALKVEGTLDFALVGILAGLTGALARASISVFVVSTFDTDWVLVKEERLEDARVVLRSEGYLVQD